ncbi:hypothetical protein Lal_00012623 [Lupinus albus]|uniref:Peroxidase n=1 Tax=Lupinus albus TaxID=3870 RepID=A0A6A4NQL0_LUPAL|nr:putative peroxidase [Lupinus albus]KAF1883706.1 hypothetical protein Lal_00012623 [Lupinus albus]
MKIIGIIILMAMFIVFNILSKSEGKLVENFYNSTCPNVESIVRNAVTKKFKQTNITGQATLRLFFHDCFVEGCDASIIISSENGNAEKDASENMSLAGDGFDTVMKAKKAVEAVCPQIVSCADILALATRDVITLVGGPSFNVELGRRDGLVSQASRVKGKLPKANFDLNQLNTMFLHHNLTQTDMIALSGAHTIGVSHCDQFANRLYPSIDPTLDSNYAQKLKATCPKKPDPNTIFQLDIQTSRIFDNLYYQNLVSGKGLLSSDQVLFTNPKSRSTILEFAKNPNEFNNAFVIAMRKLGRVGVKTGNKGEIRRDCSKFNS